MSKLPVSCQDEALSYHLYLFHKGGDCRAYEFLGAHPGKSSGRDGVFFRVWAPGAARVSVTGSFNGWDPAKNPMEKISVGVWQCHISGVKPCDSYKFCIDTPGGARLFKADPCAFHAETRPKTASKFFDLSGYQWNDDGFVLGRAKTPPYDRPINIYELHPGSFRLHADGSFLSYRELAAEVVSYVKRLGYTHVELMPVSEHPLDDSWGYQCTGYFAPTSRFGTPHDFMYFVDLCHQSGLGVILDWVPAHFPKDDFGLSSFDGGFLYEYSEPEKREHPDWGTLIFDYGRNEVCSFLISAAAFWFDKYHIDGLRVDAVASMLYLDYGRKGRCIPNIYGGRENLEAISFFRKLNEHIFASWPGVLMIAEESTAWPMVTKPAYLGGLGFNFKWNMGWMNDTLTYMKTDPVRRQYCHDKLTFPLTYAFSENFVLPLSHDEVVHGKKSLLSKMPGDYDQKFASLRTLFGHMMASPGKKLLFMGGEFGQFIEWDFKKEPDYHLTENYASHRMLFDYVTALNFFYLENPPLWENDSDWQGFGWLCHEDNHNNIIAYRRIAKNGDEVIVLLNFAPVRRDGYRIGLENPGRYAEALSSDEVRFGGSGVRNLPVINTEPVPWQGKRFSAEFTAPPLSAVYLKPER